MMNVFGQIPAPQALLTASIDDESLREALKEVYKGKTEDALLAYKLLGYILATNRTTIKQLKPEEKLPLTNPDMFTQFILTSSDPNKERIFT